MSDLMHLYIGSGSSISHREQDVNEFLFRSLNDYLGQPCENPVIAAAGPQSTSFIRRGQYGKPYFIGSLADVNFSISHSGRYIAVLFAGAASGEVGLDIEDTGAGRSGRVQDAVRLMKIAERFFTPEEAAWVREDPPERFFRIWTGKESYIKYTGRGLGQGLDTFSVLSPPDDVLIEQIKLPYDKVTDLVCSRCCSLRGGAKDVKIEVYD
jgi:phosphopantetheinyl transferase